ncbi:hypothetical protein EDB84DRAFT_1573194 [Lactarius hengduanensis]|nr:hypothetical protein EDB84DRAFT_1573194 [Lactarius hengduanensis]
MGPWALPMCKARLHVGSTECYDKDLRHGLTNTLKKSRALSLFFKYSNSTSSTDRLRRVQQQARYVQSEPETLVDDSSEELGDILMVDNPIATLLSCEDNIFLCIGKVIGIHIGSKAVDHLRLDVLLEDNIRITYQAYSLVCTIPSDDDPDDNMHTGKYDWEAQSLLPMRFKVPGNLVQPINPALTMPPSHTPSYLFETSTLIAFASTLRDRLSKPQLKFIPQTEQTDRFPYRERSGMACFVAETVYEVWEFNTHECPSIVPTAQMDPWLSGGYNMRLHFQHQHQGVDAVRHEDLWKMTAGEADAMAKIWANHRKQPQATRQREAEGTSESFRGT